MTKEELTAWATANGWRPIAGHLSLAKPRAPNEPIVRLLLKATVATLEIRKPAGKWEKIASSAYAKQLDVELNQTYRALMAKVGEKASCGIYEWRPSPCREFAAGSDACNRVRLRHGLPALETGLL